MKKTILFLVFLIALAVASLSLKAQSWKLTGNSSTDPNVNFLGTIDKIPLAFRTNNVEWMRITRNGNVGIGTGLPQAKLNIDGGSVVSLTSPGYLILGNTASSNMVLDYNVIQSRYNGGGSNLYLNYYGGASWIGSHSDSSIPAIYANADGRVGIGSSGTQAGYTLTVNSFLTGGAIYINDPGAGYFILGTKSGNTGEGLRMNISSTSNPYSAIRGHTDGNGYGVLAEATGQFGYGVEGYSSQSFGVYGGTGNSSSYAAYFNGNVFCTGSYLGSDQKLKQNIQDFSSAMALINQLHPKQYQFRQDGNYKMMNLPQGEHYGLIAQDVEKILPNLVKNTNFDPSKNIPSLMSGESKNAESIDFKALNYTELIPILIKAIQEQQQQIDELKQTVQNLSSNQNNSSLKSTTYNVQGASLQQNLPNPFSQNTLIRCIVPASAKQAQLTVYSVDGKPLKSYTLNNRGENQVTVTAGTLPAGQYLYSLLVDGNKLDSKTMVLTK